MQLTVNVAFTYVYRHVSIGSGIPMQENNERHVMILSDADRTAHRRAHFILTFSIPLEQNRVAVRVHM